MSSGSATGESSPARGSDPAPFASHAYMLVSAADLALVEERMGAKHKLSVRLREALAELQEPTLATYRQAARANARAGHLEVDDNAIVSISDDGGAYVMAWVWVSDEEIETLGAES